MHLLDNIINHLLNARMKILIACEESGRVRDAFIRHGHNAISCDLLPTSAPGPHIQGYLEDVIGNGSEWDLIIAFPPCTYLSSSGLHWNGRVEWRAEKTEYALRFVCMILNRKCPVWLENPRGCITTRIGFNPDTKLYYVMPKASNKHEAKHNLKRAIRPAQVIQPNEFGEDASKETYLFKNYRNNFPLLRGTKKIAGRKVLWNGKVVERWANQTDSGQNRLGPSEYRAEIRSKTYYGIAEAMAKQWDVIPYL